MCAGTVAALVFWWQRHGLGATGREAEQAVAAFGSCVFWGLTYVMFHRLMFLLPEVWRPFFAPIWGVLWWFLALPGMIWGETLRALMSSWAEAAYLFTCVAAVAHWLCLLRAAPEASPPPLPVASPPPAEVAAPEVGFVAGLLLAFPALGLAGLAVVLLQSSFWVTSGPEGAKVIDSILYAVPALAGTPPYLAAYLLLGRVRPLHRPLWTPLWALGWFVLTPVCALLFWFALLGFMAIAMAYAFSCLAAAAHFGLMLAWRGVLRRRAGR